MKIQLKRSNVLQGGAAKEPTAGQMEYGELAVNYNVNDPAVFIKDSNDNIVRIAGAGAEGINDVIVSDTTPPTTDLSEGQLWWNSNSESGKLFVLYDDPSGGGGTDAGGLKWVEASPTPEIPSIFPDLDNGNNQPGTLDDRYLSTEADAGNQTVASTGTTTFDGLVEAGSGVKVTGGSDPTLVSVYGSPGSINFSDGSELRCSIGLYNTVFESKSTPVSTTGNNSGYVFKHNNDTTGNVGSVGCISASLTADLNNSTVQSVSLFESSSVILSNYDNVQELSGFRAAGTLINKSDNTAGFRSEIGAGDGTNYNFYAKGNAPNFLKGDTYIGGTVTRNTRELWESTLTEEQKEQLTAGTLTIPANVSTPGDGSFARQWYYDQQDAETQAELDAGTLEYPTHLAAATFTDTFALGDNTSTNLMATGISTIKNGLQIGRSVSSAASVYGGISLNANGPITTFINKNTAGHVFKIQAAADSSATKTEVPFEIKSNGQINISNSDASSYSIYCEGSAPNYFAGITEHASGVKVTGGVLANTETGITSNGSDLFIVSGSRAAQQIYDGTDVTGMTLAPLSGDTLPGGNQFGLRIEVGSTDTTATNYNGVNVLPSTDISGASNVRFFNVSANGKSFTSDLVSGFTVENLNCSSGDVAAFTVENSLTCDAGNRKYAYKADLTTQSDRDVYNFYAGGTAPNYFKGQVTLGEIALNDTPVGSPRLFGSSNASISSGNVCAEFKALTANRTGLMSFTASDGVRGSIETAPAGGGIIITGNGDPTTPFLVQEMDARTFPSSPAITNAAGTVQALSPKTGGFIAHELQQHFPLAVTGTQDEEEAIGTLADYDGTVLETEVAEPGELTYTEDITDEYGVTTATVRTRTWTATGTRPVYQGVDQTKLIPLLTKALQESLDKIEVLEQRLSDAGIA